MLEKSDSILKALKECGCVCDIVSHGPHFFRLDIRNERVSMIGNPYTTKARAIYTAAARWNNSIRHWERRLDGETAVFNYGGSHGVVMW